MSSDSILSDSRKNILSILLKSVFLLLIICLIIDSISIMKGSWHWTFLLNYVQVVIIVFLISSKQVSLTLKSYGFNLICLIFSIYFYLTYGSLPAPILILLVSGMTASVLLGMKRGLYIVLANVLVLLFTLLNYKFGWIEVVSISGQEPGVISFVTITMTFLISSIASIYVPGSLKNCLHREINERKKAEAESREYAERQVHQIKEIHHRVKNNMQIISSMLNLQSYKTKSDEVKRVMENSRDRITSMALLHENIYKSSVVEDINMERYLKSITQSLQSAHYSEVRNFKLHHDISDISLNMDSCIPVGLIVNELVTNSMKYAFNDCEGGDIWVELHKNDVNTVLLVVRDNGIGIPQKVNHANNGSMGLFLTDIFVKQLQGKLSVSSEEGTYFEIEFKIQNN